MADRSAVVTKISMHHTLYFSGIIEPITKRAVISPFEGTIVSMPHHYGEKIKEGDLLFVLNSQEFEKQYHDALFDYLKAKDAEQIAKRRLLGMETLWKDGLIAKNALLSERAQRRSVKIAYLQAKRRFNTVMEKIEGHLKPPVLDTKISNARKELLLKAPLSGIWLYPPKVDNVFSSLEEGSKVKAGEVLGFVGDLSRLAIHIQVNEVELSTLSQGMSAHVTSPHFGKDALIGTLQHIDAEALEGKREFGARVEVSHLSPEMAEKIRVGMHVILALKSEATFALALPSDAIYEKEGRVFVTVQDHKNKKDEREISIGKFQGKMVAIESGLQEGDKVVF